MNNSKLQPGSLVDCDGEIGLVLAISGLYQEWVEVLFTNGARTHIQSLYVEPLTDATFNYTVGA